MTKTLHDAITNNTPDESVPARSLGPTTSFIAVIVGMIAVISGLRFGSPINSITNLSLLGAGALALCAGVFGIVDRRHDISAKTKTFGGFAVALVAMSMLFGLQQQDYINGHPVLEVGSTASQYDSFNALADDMELVRRIDAALSSDPVVIRANERQVNELSEAALQRSATLHNNSNHFPELTAVTAQALDSAHQALTASYRAAVERQDGSTETSTLTRERFNVDVVAAVEQFVETAETHGFSDRDWWRTTIAFSEQP